jgi:hypothetical protein
MTKGIHQQEPKTILIHFIFALLLDALKGNFNP